MLDQPTSHYLPHHVYPNSVSSDAHLMGWNMEHVQTTRINLATSNQGFNGHLVWPFRRFPHPLTGRWIQLENTRLLRPGTCTAAATIKRWISAGRVRSAKKKYAIGRMFEQYDEHPDAKTKAILTSKFNNRVPQSPGVPPKKSTIEIISTVGNHIIHASILVATPWIPSLEWIASWIHYCTLISIYLSLSLIPVPEHPSLTINLKLVLSMASPLFVRRNDWKHTGLE